MARHALRPVSVLRLVVLTVFLALVAAACGDLAGGRALGPASSTANASTPAMESATPLSTPRPTTPATRDCAVSWQRSYRTLGSLVDDADLVVRAVVIGSGTTTLRAFGANGVISHRDASRTTLQVRSALFGGPAPAAVNVLEDVCPGLDGTPGDEWLVFLRKADPRYGPDTPGDHYYAVGGPQGLMRLRDGRVVGPFFTFQRAIHAYEGATVGEVEADLAAVRPLDREAGRALVERYGWRVLDGSNVTDVDLPADRTAMFFLEDTPFAAYVDASRRAGLDLGAAGPGSARILALRLEADRPSTEKQYTAHVVYRAGRIVGAWVVAGIPWTWSLFALDQRADAIALGGRY